MARQLPQPNAITNASDATYLRSLVRELELRLTEIEADHKIDFGLYDYNDLATQTTPISVTGGAGWVLLTNDTLGPQTSTDWILKSVPAIWTGGTTNQFDFSGVDLGASVDLRIDISVTTTTPNTACGITMFFGVGDPNTYSIPMVSDRVFKAAGTYQISEYNSFYIGNDLTKSNPAEIKIKADNNITVKVNGWYLRVATKR